MIRLLSAAFLFAVVSCAPSPQFEGKEISSLEMRFEGKRTVDEARLRKMMKSQPGTFYSAARLDDDIGTLYLSGLIDDMKFNAKPDGDAVRLIATVEMRPVLAMPFRISGNQAFHLESLMRETGLKKNTPINPQTMEKVRRRLERFYHRQGYPDAKVQLTYSTKDGPQGAPPETDDFHFLIEEREKR
jgi:Outer membrane protein/protective antigen OMA87